ncbi:MAG: hypothetical protein ACYDAO_07730 [Thermoplasmataceae archaeon]
MSNKICQVRDCKAESFQTVDTGLAKKVLELTGDTTKVHLCKEHYKKFKKETKEERKNQRADWV